MLNHKVGYCRMQTSQNHGNLDGAARFYHQPPDELESYLLAPSDNLDHCTSYEGGSHSTQFSVLTPEQHSTIESSTGSGCCPSYNSPSTVSFSSNGSPICQRDHLSDMNHSGYVHCYSDSSRSRSVDNDNDLEHKLRELENVMLGPESQIFDAQNITISGALNQNSLKAQSSKQAVEIIQTRNLKEIMVACAKAVLDNDLLTYEWLMSELRLMVSVCGEPLQRLAAYMLEGLVARLSSSGSSIYKSLRCKEPTSDELLSHMHFLYEICPYFKFGYLSANGAIADAMKDENRIHIIDFQIAQGIQWITLIHALASQPGGPPNIRITGIDDSTSAYARGGGLEIVGQRLSIIAKSCKVPFEFHAVPVSACDVQSEHLKVQPGEALAVNFALMLHHMPDESVTTENHRDRLLRMVKSLSPKVVTLIEQESNTNTAPFFLRFRETLDYYLAIFEALDVTLPRDQKERINVEQFCLARDIVNIIACEGPDRVERHELLGKWRSRFSMAGFTPYPLSSFINATIKTLLENYCENYRLEERDGALYLGWKNKDLVASCAWQ
ncbi:scarecrow-like transcription factor PAT1 [Olea europaea subsp. europaea]|uniref:Scarecrow-like transcription factor PAT1 n=1 Tax=Olea europaea subsp. europaea TaxID=158383 RepID=A0A8S0T905_OLEEU|nr:scarecrow-like transcription factor PAT1 [Olea europaea subsp. europaea]